ncbi:MAG: hypothetical protein PHU56_00860 [Candidatus Pacebacteria bacterium]|nr:hypothetical protein [Candidatus Paceibacterota bacterium]
MLREIQTINFFVLREGGRSAGCSGDEDSDFYKPVFIFSKTNEQKEIEEIKSRFLIELMEKYGYQTEEITFDAGFGLGMFDFAGLIVWQKNAPYIIADFLSKNAPKEQTQKAKKRLLDKAKTFGVEFAVLVKGDKRKAFMVAGQTIRPARIPKKEKQS